MKYATSYRPLTKLADVGRHVSSERRRSLRGRILAALLANVALIAVAAFAAYQIWDISGDRSSSRRGPAAASGSPSATRSVTPSATPSVTSPGTVTLALTVTGPECQVFVRVPGGDILVDRNLLRGQTVRLDEQRLSVVLGDAGAARVYVNGTLRPPGKPGERVAFVAQKG